MNVGQRGNQHERETVADSWRISADVMSDLFKMFEMYTDEAAYKAHLETSHFKKYKATTQQMVKSLKLIETTPILLGAKTK